MVKVKRIVHLQDKNIAEDDAAAAVKPEVSAGRNDGSTAPAKAAVADAAVVKSDVIEGGSPKDDPKGVKEEDGPEERRSTRKIKKKRHKYGEEDVDDDFGLLCEVDDVIRSTTPVRATSKAVKRLLQTPASAKKKTDVAAAEGISTETPPGKRPRLSRAATRPADATPKKEDVRKEAGSTSSSLCATPIKSDENSPAKKEETPMPEEEVPPPPPVPKETVTFRVDASNPTGFQNLVDFLIRVLRRKDYHGFFAHPPTETLCPGYFSRVQARMDLVLMQQRFEAGYYQDLSTLRDDAMLLFDNALEFYDATTVMYHSARKLRRFVRKTTFKDGLLGMKFVYPTLMAGISIKQLGLDEAELAAQKPTVPQALGEGNEGLAEVGAAAAAAAAASSTAAAAAASGPYDEEGNMLVEIDRPEELLVDEDLKIEWIRMEKEDKTRSKSAPSTSAPKPSSTKPPLQDNVIPREIVTTWINAVGISGGSGKRATSISNPHLTRPAETALKRRDASYGLTSLAIVNPDNAAVYVDPNGEALYRAPTTISSRGAGGDNASMSAAISMKQTLNRLTSAGGATSSAVPGFKEDRRNLVKPVKAIEETPFCSFGPSYDSRFANLSKEDSDQLISSFHSEDDLVYADDIRNAIGEALGNGGVGGCGELDYELAAVDGLLDALSGGEYSKRKDVVESRKQFGEMEAKIKKTGGVPSEASAMEVDNREEKPLTAATPMEQLLASSAAQIESLHRMQLSRLSRPPPPHLAMVGPPSTEELGLAEGVTSALTTMAKKVTPEYLVSQRALFQALGVDLAKRVEEEEPVESKASGVDSKEVPAPLNKLEAPTSPVAKCQVPQNIFQRTFASGISFAAS